MISLNIDDNISALEAVFSDCGDFVGRKFPAGGTSGAGALWLYAAYIDMLTDRAFIDRTIINRLIKPHWLGKKGGGPDGLFERLRNSGLLTADFKECSSMGEAVNAVLSGDLLIFIGGCANAVIASAKEYPSRGVNAAETEVTVQGSKEAFTEGLRVNTALIRRRLRDPALKVKQSVIGRRSQTDVALMFIDGIARAEVVSGIEARLSSIDIDGITDSGQLEQLIERDFMSPFPQAQLTERPDKAAASILEGRVVVIVDNSPFALILPATLNVFFQSPDDYAGRWQIMSFTRAIRYAAAFMAVALPGFYIAVADYHPQILPLLLLVKMSAAGQTVPFPLIVEILLMDAAFELLREAGIRLPAAAGGTIGIVGGLIIGQAAVEAGLCSPVVVVVTALAGVSAFSIPHVSLANGLRLVKYMILFLSAALGLLGFWAGLLLALTHLAGLSSLGFPYLLPFTKDGCFRAPSFMMTDRPDFANPRQLSRLRHVKKAGGQ